MDKKQFQEFLESVAEIKQLKPSTSATIRLDENSGGEVRYDNEWVEIGKDHNPTLGFKFLKLKPKPNVCELGCGKIVDNQKIEKRLYAYPEKHWRTQCKSCHRTVSPDGKQFIKDSASVQNAFYRWFYPPKE